MDHNIIVQNKITVMMQKMENKNYFSYKINNVQKNVFIIGIYMIQYINIVHKMIIVMMQ